MTSRFHNDEILSHGLVADILSVSKETVRKWSVNGRLPAARTMASGLVGYRWEDLLGFPAAQDLAQSRWDLEATIRPVRPYRAIELFAGGGGLALGLEVAGFETAALNEMDHDACDTLRRNRPSWNVIEGDVSTLDFTGFEAIDLVSGGFPCQAFSYAGNRAGFEDARGTLFFEFARVIRETQAKVFLGENVRGLLTHDSGRTLEVIKSVISDIGYTLVKPRILKALFYRVPQKRERLALVGIRNDLATRLEKFTWPSVAGRVYTLRDALCKGELFDCDVPPSAGVSYPEHKAKIIAKVPPGGYWRDLPDALQREYLKGSYHLEGGKTGMARRLSWDEPSLTLTCAPAQNQTGRCHPVETRPLTIREYARIQTFPDEWVFCGSTMSQYKQIGNAVPVNLAAALGRSIVAFLNEIEANAPAATVSLPLVAKATQAVKPRKGSPAAARPEQLLLFDSDGLYLVDTKPLTLQGSYRKACREWIIANNLYSYPINDGVLGSLPELSSIRRLILRRRNEEPLHFAIKGYTFETKTDLAKLGYPVNKRHSAKKQYILFRLEPLADEPSFQSSGRESGGV
jgi:DNA (cytosine-5)-methyltransferase 1